MSLLSAVEQLTTGGNMGDEFNSKLCDERHLEIKDNFRILFNRLNWFYIIAIANLVATLVRLKAEN